MPWPLLARRIWPSELDAALLFAKLTLACGTASRRNETRWTGCCRCSTAHERWCCFGRRGKIRVRSFQTRFWQRRYVSGTTT